MHASLLGALPLLAARNRWLLTEIFLRETWRNRVEFSTGGKVRLRTKTNTYGETCVIPELVMMIRDGLITKATTACVRPPPPRAGLRHWRCEHRLCVRRTTFHRRGLAAPRPPTGGYRCRAGDGYCTSSLLIFEQNQAIRLNRYPETLAREGLEIAGSGGQTPRPCSVSLSFS